MKQNQVIQLSLVAIAAGLIFFTYYYSGKKNKTASIDKNAKLENNTELTGETSNIIENVNYIGASGGTFFELNAAIAEVKYEEPNISYLQDVLVFIKMGERTIRIKSDKAVLDKMTNDCEFSGNVEVTEKDNIITSDNLDLFMSKNLITAYNNLNVKYNDIGGLGFLIADKVNIDILKNEANIFMFKKNDKVRINYKN